jgi:dihydroflavonol-4-reductase
MPTVFVTGGNGFIGSVVVARLIEAGWTIRCLLRPTSDTSRIADHPWERAEGDVRDLGSLRRGMAGCSAVIHLASLSSWNDIHSPLMEEVVVVGTRNVLAAAEEQGRPRVVFVSSTLAVNGSERPCVFDESAAFTLTDRQLIYSHCKRAAESLCRQAAGRGLPVVIVNPSEVYGPNDTALVTAGNLVDFWKSNPVLVCRGGTGIVHVADVAEGVVRALDRGRPGERYILSGDNLTVRELAELTLEWLGQHKRILLVPNGLLRLVARLGARLHLPLPFNPNVIPYATRYWFVSSTRARAELGVTFRPARETIASVMQWLQTSGRITRQPRKDRLSPAGQAAGGLPLSPTKERE